MFPRFLKMRCKEGRESHPLAFPKKPLPHFRAMAQMIS